MSNTIKVLINSDGITGREQNPYEFDRANNLLKYDTFEANVKSYTVIGSCKAGDVVECESLDWYCKEKRFNNNPVQIIESVKDGFEYENILDIISNSEFLHLDFFEAYKVVEAKESKLNVEDNRFSFLLKSANLDPVMISPVSGLMEKAAEYQHHKTIESVIGILHYEMTIANPDYLQQLDNIITLVKQLKP